MVEILSCGPLGTSSPGKSTLEHVQILDSHHYTHWRAIIFSDVEVGHCFVPKPGFT